MSDIRKALETVIAVCDSGVYRDKAQLLIAAHPAIDDVRLALASPAPDVVAEIGADAINMVLAEHARIENGQLANAPYLAVLIAEMIETGVVPNAPA